MTDNAAVVDVSRYYPGPLEHDEAPILSASTAWKSAFNSGRTGRTSPRQ
jgi:hypothetical protein